MSLLEERTVLWLSGVRRSGKTTLCKSLEDVQYFDCELPRVRQQLENIEHFFKNVESNTIVLDEIHRLLNPSEVLKIAADHFPKVKVVATGSSTLAAKKKFKDTLTGRKRELWLLPSICQDLTSFGIKNLDIRMLHGGLPPMLLAKKLADQDFLEWIESYWAKDVQELFSIDRRSSFMKFVELMFRQSGELFEAQSFAAPCEISRQTVQNYLSILETTLLANVLRPFSDGSTYEVKSQPKVYGFDSGFVCFFQGIASLHQEDRGKLLEHLVLGELLSLFHRNEVFYWRNKSKLEVDFVIKSGRKENIIAIECKASSSKFSPEGIHSFRNSYPNGRNLCVSLDIDGTVKRNIQGIEITFCSIWELQHLLLDAALP